ncbi:MAG: gephyrin-like molybdotransferase Glp [Nitrososphaerales archaeon]
MRVVFKKLVTVEEALKALDKHVKPHPLGIEEVKITEAHGRVLGEDVIARINLPPFSRAIVDGYVVRAIDTSFASEVNPVRLKVIGKLHAGEESLLEIKEKECIEIDTGAIIPKNADAVVRVEDTSIDGDYVIIKNSVGKGSGLASLGSDVYHGQFVMSKGEELTAEKIGVLAGLGCDKVKVFSKPKVAIFSTGNELIEPGSELKASKIYDVNQYSIGALVQKSGCTPIYLGIKKDNLEEIREAVIEGLKLADAIIMSGSTSAGVSDLAYKVFDGLGSPGLIVHGIAAKPGKPTIIAAINDKPIFGLPGFPVSALIIYDLIVDPFLRAMSGKKLEDKKKIGAILVTRYLSERGRREYLPVFLKNSKKGLMAIPILGGSGAIASLSSADGILEIPENVELIEKDERVNITLFSDAKISDIIVVGDLSPISQVILSKLRKKAIKVREEFRGLEHGLAWMRDGIADLLVSCTKKSEKILKSIPLRVKKIRSYTMDMVWAFYGDGISSGSTFILPKIGSGLRDYAEDKIKGMVRDFDLIETWSYDSAMDLVSKRRNMIALLPLCVAVKHDLNFIDAFPAKVSYFIHEDFLVTEIGKKLTKIMKSKETTRALSSMLGISMK